MKGPLIGRALALLAKIRPSRKGLPGTNTLANNKHMKIKAVKSFLTLVPGESYCSLQREVKQLLMLSNLLPSSLTASQNKLERLSLEFNQAFLYLEFKFM